MAFTVITLTNVPPSLRGDLTKWMQEIATGVYVGQFNPKIREALWERVVKSVGKGEATLSYHVPNEIGYTFKTINTEREIVEWDGIPLVKIPAKNKETTSLKQGFSKAAKYRKAHRYRQHATIKRADYVIIDIETDGLNPQKNHIIEIGALKILPEGQETFSKLIQYDGDLPQQIVELTQIDNALLKNEGEDLRDALQELLAFVGDAVIVGYNIRFDLQFLNAKLKENHLPIFENTWIDIMEQVKKEKDHLANFKLSTVLRAYDIQNPVAHRGLLDCKQIYELGIKVNVFS